MLGSYRGFVNVSYSNKILDPMDEWFVHEAAPPGGTFWLPRYISRYSPRYILQIPYWLIALVFGIAPAISYYSRLVLPARRRTYGLCATCGYNLKGTLTRCPECGASPTSASPNFGLHETG